jgi:hypothetical protein
VKKFDTTRFVTGQALKPTSELSLEKVDDDAIIPYEIDLPFFLACDLLWESLEDLFSRGRHFVLRLVEHTVQVLVQPIKQEAQKLL